MARVGLLPTGTFYTMFYARWKTNLKVYAFILYGGFASDRVHALNLGARQLSSMERAKLFAIIRRLGSVPAIRTLQGPYVYRLFRTFAKKEMSKCYRTYLRSYITRASLINYGLYKEGQLPISAFTSMVFDRTLYAQAQRDLVVKMINSNMRAYDMGKVQGMFSKPGAVAPGDISQARK